MVRARVSCGINELDALIGGGFQERKAYLISGEPGTGKTIFCMQFILEALVNNESAIYVTIDEKPAHLIEDAESMGWNLEKYIAAKKLEILDLSPYFADLRLGKVKEIDMRELIADLSRHLKPLKAKKMVIDPLAPLFYSEEGQVAIRAYVRELIFSIEDNLGCTFLLTSHVRLGENYSLYGMEEYIVSGVILLRMVKVEKRYIRTLFIKKMRGTPLDLSEYSFDIVSSRGIVIRQPI